MTDSSAGYHEPVEELGGGTREMHRAIVSLMEELEAVDWYQQRADACNDPDLVAVLEHNRDEEVEHAMMVLEWLRRRSPTFDRHMRTYLFTEAPIVAVEEAAVGGGAGEADPDGPGRAEPHLAIGSLRGAT